MIVDVGVVKNHIKPKADSTLYNMRKTDLIKYIRTLEHNYNVAVSFNENQAKYIESLGVLPKWIPVSERLPDKNVSVLVRDRATGEITTAYLNDFDSFVFNDGRGHGASHWMPLPEPPNEE